jgi:hypothetical protein
MSFDFTHRKEQRLLKWGKPARAVVTSVTMGGGERNRFVEFGIQ